MSNQQDVVKELNQQVANWTVAIQSYIISTGM